MQESKEEKMVGYERGSEWRRWDLHMHTPGTQKNDQYKGNNIEEKWGNFYQSIEDYIGNGSDPLKNIAVVGITDYLSIDNYMKVIKDGRFPKSIKMILPNVEMRMAPLAKQTPVNIHCLFDPAIANQLESRFFSKLYFSYGGAKYSASHADLQRLGREFRQSELTDDEAYSIGVEQFIITPDIIEAVFKGDQELRDKTIIAVSNNSSDGVSGITQHQGYTTENGSQMDATRRSMYYMADLIFSSNSSDINYFLGESSDGPEDIVRKYGSLKGCIHGSDAHSNEKIFEPDQKRYCWIKSDPTFNGFKQIIYEPKARIRISAIKPEEKPAYQVIDSVTFSNLDFAPEAIPFNDKLTCIIGGKSTGKSLLLHNIALAIDATQVKKKVEISQSGSRIVPEIQVNWADGTISSPGNIDEKHKIVYVPQTYLNRLTDKNEEKTEIDDIIHEIVMINTDAAEAYENMKSSLGAYKLEVDKKIYDCIQRYDGFLTKKKALADIGTKEGIKNELKRLKEKKDEITKETSITSEEILAYDDAVAAVTCISAKIAEVDREISIINDMSDVFQKIDIPSEFSPETMKIILGVISQIQIQANETWKKDKKSILDNLEKKKADFENEKNRNQQIVDKIAPKITGNEAIRKLSEQIAIEEKKQIKFDEMEKQLNLQKQLYTQVINEIVIAFDGFRKIHEEYAKLINENKELSNDDLVFSVNTPFRMEAFCNVLNETYDKRSLKAQQEWINLDTCDSKTFCEKKILQKLIEKTLDGDLRITKGKSTEIALRNIFSDWFNSTYQVVMDGDAIGNMSPGKKALVLLKLLINLAENKCPILIDQPEDDLDNRSIFDELIPFIRRKKIDRQIIIVTHNANVVLGGDAEEVIVANQNGDNAKNKKYKFEYRTGSIEDDTPVVFQATDILSKQGIQQHICDILEGGERAFDLRRNKYRI